MSVLLGGGGRNAPRAVELHLFDRLPRLYRRPLDERPDDGDAPPLPAKKVQPGVSPRPPSLAPAVLSSPPRGESAVGRAVR
jgi:hypothetical protein